MGETLFQDEWVRVDRKAVTGGGATYATAAVDGARVASVRDNTAGKVIGALALLVVCNYAVCAVAFESFRDVLFVALGIAALSFGWAFWLAPVVHYVVIIFSGREVTLVRYATERAARDTADAILEAAGLAQRGARP